MGYELLEKNKSGVILLPPKQYQTMHYTEGNPENYHKYHRFVSFDSLQMGSIMTPAF